MKVLDKKKVDVNSLKAGMYICELDRPWIGSPFLLEGFTLRTKGELKKLQSYCEYVYIDTYRSTTNNRQETKQANSSARPHKQEFHSQLAGDFEDLDVNSPTRAKQILGKGGSIVDLSLPNPTVNFEDELYQARKTYGRLQKETTRFFKAIDTGKPPVILPLIGLVLEVIASINRNASAFEWMVMTSPDEKSVDLHCINVCILSLKFGLQLGLPDRHNRVLGLAGLTFDLGMLIISDAIVKKSSRLSEAEMGVMQKHTKVGAEILEDIGGVAQEVINVCLRHHERLQGTGYPEQLKGEDIDLLSRITAIVDTYAAITSAKHHSGRNTPGYAMNELYNLRDKGYDSELIEAFINSIGMFPVGSAIQTQTGEIGLVVSNNAKSKLSPSVLMVLDAQKRPINEEVIIDLATAKNDKGQPLYSIKHAVNANDFDINPKDCFRS